MTASSALQQVDDAPRWEVPEEPRCVATPMTVRITRNLCTSTSAQVKLFPPADQGARTLTIDSTEGTSDPGEQSESNAPISAHMG